MSPKEARDALERLGLGVNEFARIAGLNQRTVARWLEDGGDGPSPPAALALRLMLGAGLDPQGIARALERADRILAR